MAAYTTIDDPSAYFQTKLYSGDGNDDRSITLDSDTDLQPDFLLLLERNSTSGHAIHDSVRGVDKFLFPYTTNADGTSTARVKSFNSDGFTVGTSGAANGSSDTYAALCWKESATAGFDIVAHTGNSSNHTVAHSLSAVPEMVISKNRSAASQWQVYTKTIGNTQALQLNGSGAPDTSSTYYNNTSPTSGYRTSQK